jgi:hypothetical protein
MTRRSLETIERTRSLVKNHPQDEDSLPANVAKLSRPPQTRIPKTVQVNARQLLGGKTHEIGRQTS